MCNVLSLISWLCCVVFRITLIAICCHGACFSLVFMQSPVVRSKHPFRAMRCPVNVYCDRDISCMVIVTYHVLISVLLVSCS